MPRGAQARRGTRRLPSAEFLRALPVKLKHAVGGTFNVHHVPGVGEILHVENK
jgi:hypothetical protein